MRQDELDTFVRLATGGTVVWRTSPTFVYHATEDDLTPVCGTRTVLDDSGPAMEFDRSEGTMACHRCQGLVRRIRSPEERRERRERAVQTAAVRARSRTLETWNVTACSSGKVTR